MKEKARILCFVATPKVKMINVRLTPAVHDAFKLACELRGGSMSSLLHQFIVRTIREEKEADPKAFKTGLPFSGVASGGAEKKRKTG